MTELLVADGAPTHGSPAADRVLVRFAERRFARTSYQQAVATEIVDGEIEVLAAGEWRAFKPGTSEYHVTDASRHQPAAGRFLLTVAENKSAPRMAARSP